MNEYKWKFLIETIIIYSMSILKTKDRQPRNFEEFRLVIQPPLPPWIAEKNRMNLLMKLVLFSCWSNGCTLWPMRQENRRLQDCGIIRMPTGLFNHPQIMSASFDFKVNWLKLFFFNSLYFSSSNKIQKKSL